MPTETIPARTFREILGHYPTGVCVVTGVDGGGAPAGMAVGTFTSVSLGPPLIAFLPAKDSGSFARLRTGTSFCVNVLAADQQQLCRRFAARGADKFAGLPWTPAPSGAPRLEGVIAWIDCGFERVTEAGDHYIVLGRVHDLAVERPAPPLVFFQGDYGVPGPLASGRAAGVRNSTD